MMKKYIAPWGIALISAVVIHLLIIRVVGNTHWFGAADPSKKTSSFEVSLIPARQDTTPLPSTRTKQQASNAIANQTTSGIDPQNGNIAESPESNIDLRFSQHEDDGMANSRTATKLAADTETANTSTATDSAKLKTQEGISDANKVDISKLEKPILFDLSKITLSPDSSDNDLKGIFSPSLQAQIDASKAAQKDYLKGQVKEVNYPITKDADGTRYVNIKGVCWRMPKEGSNEGWVIVFAGCSGQTKSFHFELNISPSTLLGPDSPFSLGK